MNPTGEQKLLTVLAHLGYLLGGLGLVIVPLVIMILKKDSDPFVYHHAKQALVAQLATTVVTAAVGLLTALLIGILLLPLAALAWLLLLITSILAAIKSLNGDYYRYPLIQSLVEKL